jgi:uncharacterized protein (TIGR00255 family)
MVLKSMTGFGRGEAEQAGLQATVEIRSVNHRFCEVVVRIPRPFILLEERIKEQVQSQVSRGHLDIFVTVTDNNEKKRNVKLDKELVVAYHKCLRELSEMLQIDFQPDVFSIAQYPGVIIEEEAGDDLEQVWVVAQGALTGALQQLGDMRRREGERIARDLDWRRERIASVVGEIRERSPQLEEELRLRLRKRLQALSVDGEIDEMRLATEVVLFAERSCITEELVRLSSHLGQLAEMLNSTDPVGRKIDFLIQELNREINTLGSKAADLMISPLVIEVKSELEKMREQVQNVE